MCSGFNGGAVFNNGDIDAHDVHFVANTARGNGIAVFNTKLFIPYGVAFEGNRISCTPGKYAYDKVRLTNVEAAKCILLAS